VPGLNEIFIQVVGHNNRATNGNGG
jgi:hypothetical protein